MEPISPELVLVDPELSEAERARLRALDAVSASPLPSAVSARAADLSPLPKPGTAAEERGPQEPAPRVAEGEPRRRLRNAVLTLSVMANAILIAVVVAGSREKPAASVFPSALRTVAVPEASKRPPTGSHRTTGNRRTKPQRRVTPRETSAVERLVLAAVVQSPRGKLPPALIDPTTGLGRNNLQAVCQPRVGGSFFCVVRPARHKPAEGLYVRYRPAGKGRSKLSWSPYRAG
jgi:hypothetical protein